MCAIARRTTKTAAALLGLALAASGGSAAGGTGDAFAPVGTAQPFLPGVVSTAYSEVRVAIGPDGRTVLWGSTDRPGGPGGWDIWMVRRADDGAWSAPQPVPFDTPHKEFDPSFAPDGRSVWFFSNRPGGFGGDDVWHVAFDARSGRFGAAENAGAGVNSAGDEWAPAIGDDGRLLFASDGRGGRGRHDLFVSTFHDGAWQPAQPLPGEVNSADDEFDAVLLEHGRVLVYAHSVDVENATIELWSSLRDADGAYRRPAKLDARINAQDGFALGPSPDPARAGVLLFSGRRPEANLGKSDIYAIRYRRPSR